MLCSDHDFWPVSHQVAVYVSQVIMEKLLYFQNIHFHTRMFYFYFTSPSYFLYYEQLASSFIHGVEFFQEVDSY
jgi:ADP-dependent phosphofructokinase/glucokinase